MRHGAATCPIRRNDGPSRADRWVKSASAVPGACSAAASPRTACPGASARKGKPLSSASRFVVALSVCLKRRDLRGCPRVQRSPCAGRGRPVPRGGGRESARTVWTPDAPHPRAGATSVTTPSPATRVRYAFLPAAYYFRSVCEVRG